MLTLTVTFVAGGTVSVGVAGVRFESGGVGLKA